MRWTIRRIVSLFVILGRRANNDDCFIQYGVTFYIYLQIASSKQVLCFPTRVIWAYWDQADGFADNYPSVLCRSILYNIWSQPESAECASLILRFDVQRISDNRPMRRSRSTSVPLADITTSTPLSCSTHHIHTTELHLDKHHHSSSSR